MTTTQRTVKAASTANIANLNFGSNNIDGVSMANGDTVLIKDQTNPAQNGIYQFDAGGFERHTSYDTWNELLGMTLIVSQGTVNANTTWQVNILPGGTIGTTPVPVKRYGTPDVLLLEHGASVPAGTPAGTLIFEKG